MEQRDGSADGRLSLRIAARSQRVLALSPQMIEVHLQPAGTAHDILTLVCLAPSLGEADLHAKPIDWSQLRIVLRLLAGQPLSPARMKGGTSLNTNPHAQCTLAVDVPLCFKGLQTVARQHFAHPMAFTRLAFGKRG